MKKQLKKQAASVIVASMVLSGGAVYADSGVQAVPISANLESSVEAINAEVKFDEYYVNVQGHAIVTAAFLQDEQVMVPLREAAEALGFKVTWHQDKQTAELSLPDTPIWTIIQPDVDQYAYNKMNVTLGAAPANMNGKLFVPAAFFSEVLRSNVAFEGNQLNITSQVEDVKMHTQQGVITAINNEEDYKSIHINGTGIEGTILNIDDQTVIRNNAGEQVSLDDLTLGMSIEVKHSLAMTMSLPGQTYAYEITALEEKAVDMLGTSGAIEEIRNDEAGNTSIVVNGMGMSESSPEKIVLNIHEDTIIVDIEGNAVAREQLTQGANVLVYYGPMLTKSLPPIGQAGKIVYLGNNDN